MKALQKTAVLIKQHSSFLQHTQVSESSVASSSIPDLRICGNASPLSGCTVRRATPFLASSCRMTSPDPRQARQASPLAARLLLPKHVVHLRATFTYAKRKAGMIAHSMPAKRGVVVTLVVEEGGGAEGN